MKQILLLDNYDSFTYNLLHYILEAGACCMVRHNDDPGLLSDDQWDAVIISPGPGIPQSAGQLMHFISTFAASKPMLGVCLGHQALGLHFGARLVNAGVPVHGKTDMIHHDERGIFKGLPNPLRVCRYHSLMLYDAGTELQVSAQNKLGEIMAIRHKRLPLQGVQFHPEAILTEFGKEMIANWLETC
jgi:anthranilate synthase/aminodeoxychorismate synthase-like glutamine amidotransferase